MNGSFADIHFKNSYPDAQTERPYRLGGNVSEGEYRFFPTFTERNLEYSALTSYRTHIKNKFSKKPIPCLIFTPNV